MRLLTRLLTRHRPVGHTMIRIPLDNRWASTTAPGEVFIHPRGEPPAKLPADGKTIPDAHRAASNRTLHDHGWIPMGEWRHVGDGWVALVARRPEWP